MAFLSGGSDMHKRCMEIWKRSDGEFTAADYEELADLSRKYGQSIPELFKPHRELTAAEKRVRDIFNGEVVE